MSEGVIVGLELLKETDAAVALGLRPRALKDFRRRGEVSYRRIGRQVRYTREDLAEFIARARVPCAELCYNAGATGPAVKPPSAAYCGARARATKRREVEHVA